MGFFFKKKQKVKERTPEETFNEWEPTELRTWIGKEGFEVSSWSKEYWYEGMFLRCGFRFSIDQNNIRIAMEIASEKGDPEAPFYLAMMYRYGMIREGAKCEMCKEKAIPYLYLAKERGSVMEKAYQYIKTNRLDPHYDEDDNIAAIMGMFYANANDPLRDILGELTLPFAHLGFALMVKGASKTLQYPDCSVCIGQILVIGGRDSGNSEHDAYMKDIFYPSRSGFLYDPQMCVDVGNAILEWTIRKAAQGDEAAAYAVKKYRLKC